MISPMEECIREHAHSASTNGNGQHPGDAPAPDLSPVPFGELLAAHPNLRPVIVDNLIREGETVNVVAPSKRGKSWFLLGLILAILTGEPWLGRFPTRKGRVLLIDNELHPESIAHRIPIAAAAHAVRPEEYANALHVVSLRGRLVDLNGLWHVLKSIRPGDYDVIVLDAWYRFIPPGMDENSNADVAHLYNILDGYARHTGAAFVLVHHSTKGSQGGKSVTDVGAGAGSGSRATDLHAVLRDHEQPNAVVMELAPRSFAPIDPLGLVWDFPKWSIDLMLDCTKIKRPNAGGRPPKPGKPEKPEPKEWTSAEFAKAFIGEQAKPEKLILALAVEGGCPARKAAQLLLLAEAAKTVFRHTYPPDKKNYYATREQAITETSLARAHPPTPPKGKRGRKSRVSQNIVSARATETQE